MKRDHEKFGPFSPRFSSLDSGEGNDRPMEDGRTSEFATYLLKPEA